MIASVSPDETTTRQGSGKGGNSYVINDYFVDGPQAFLVDFAKANGVIKPHFHLVDQFQVVVRGGGKLGKTPVGPGTFHFADAYTPYGPIVAGDQGISFFTIRAAVDKTPSHYMPESRDEMTRKAGRNIAHQLEEPLYERGVVSTSTLIEPHEDGLAAYSVAAGPAANFQGVEPCSACGQYYLVMDGEVEFRGKSMPEFSSLWVDDEQESPTFATGSNAATLLVLQFPRPRK